MDLGAENFFVSFIFRFDMSGKCNSEAMRDEVQEKKRAQVMTASMILFIYISRTFYNFYITLDGFSIACRL